MKTNPVVLLERKTNKYTLDTREISRVLDLRGLGSMGKGSGSQSGKATTESATLEL